MSDSPDDGSRSEVEGGKGETATNRPAQGGDRESEAVASHQVENQQGTSKREATKQDESEQESWARTHSTLLVVVAFFGIGLTMASTVIAFLSYQAAAESSADSTKAANAAEASARAAVRQADAAVRQVALSERGLTLQQQVIAAQLAGVDAQQKSARSLERQTVERQRADAVAGRTLSTSIWGTADNGFVEFRNSGVHTLLIEAARAAAGDSPREALAKARRKQGAVEENWRPLVPGNLIQLRLTGSFIGAVASYVDAAGNRHHAYGCGQLSGGPAKPCPTPADD